MPTANLPVRMENLDLMIVSSIKFTFRKLFAIMCLHGLDKSLKLS